MPILRPLEFPQIEGPAEKITLLGVTVPCSEKRELRFRFHAFGDHSHSETVPDGNNGLPIAASPLESGKLQTKDLSRLKVRQNRSGRQHPHQIGSALQ